MPPFKYDANYKPDPKKWLALTEDQQIKAVEEHHNTKKPHPPTPNMKIHAALHSAVEKQLAMGFPPHAQHAVDRLVSEGLSRHDAVHAVGSVIAHHYVATTKGDLLGPIEYADALNKLNAAKWKAGAPKR